MTLEPKVAEEVEAAIKHAHEDEIRRWSIDRKVPLALIFAVLAQTMVFTWGAAQLSAAVKTNGEKIEKLEESVAKLEEKLDEVKDNFQTRRNAEREIKTLNDSLDRIENRVRELEQAEDEHIRNHHTSPWKQQSK